MQFAQRHAISDVCILCTDIERSIQFLPGAMRDDIADVAREFVAAGATHLIFSCPTPYRAAGVRRVWDEIVTPVRG